MGGVALYKTNPQSERRPVIVVRVAFRGSINTEPRAVATGSA
jgi:hypothetical protein